MESPQESGVQPQEASATPAEEGQSQEVAQESEEVSAEQSAEQIAEAAGSEAAIEADKSLSKPEKAAAKKALKRLKYKLDGQEFEEDLPFEIPDDPAAIKYMQEQLQMSKVSRKRMGEKAQLEKDVRSFIEGLRKNPAKALSDPNIGVDLKKLAAEIIQKDIEDSQKSPEQLENERIREELKALKEQHEKEKEEARNKHLQRLEEETFERYDTQVSKALETSNLPKTPYTVKKIAEYMSHAVKNKLNVSVDDVIPFIKEEMHGDIKEMFSVMPDEVIEGMIGKDVLGRLRKKNLLKAKAAPKTTPLSEIKDTGTKASTQAKDVKKQSFKEYFGT